MTNLSGTEIAKLTVIVTGGGYKRANSKEAAEKRFFKATADAGIPVAAGLLWMSFDAAKVALEAALAGGTEPGPIVERPANGPKPRKPATKRATATEAAQRGEMPVAPDFSAPSHARYRTRLAALVAMAEAGDIAGLRAGEIKTYSSSPKAMARYRDLAVAALEASQSDAK